MDGEQSVMRVVAGCGAGICTTLVHGGSAMTGTGGGGGGSGGSGLKFGVSRFSGRFRRLYGGRRYWAYTCKKTMYLVFSLWINSDVAIRYLIIA